jgi:hypothetical protein
VRRAQTDQQMNMVSRSSDRLRNSFRGTNQAS